MDRFREIEQMPKRVFVVGDIHGCPTELDLLLEELETSLLPQDDDLVVFVGDYVDRGPESKQVIEQLVGFQSKYPTTIFLCGNHEAMLLDFLGYGGSLGNSYIHNGGAKTIGSYGGTDKISPQAFMDILPSNHLSFLLNLDRYVILPSHVIVHAGLSPLRDVRAQLDQDIFWIRDEFIQNIHHFEKTVIFGHTPYQDLMHHAPYKIGIDTGLVYGNMLSMVELVNSDVFQVKKGAKSVHSGSF